VENGKSRRAPASAVALQHCVANWAAGWWCSGRRWASARQASRRVRLAVCGRAPIKGTSKFMYLLLSIYIYLYLSVSLSRVGVVRVGVGPWRATPVDAFG